MGDPSWPARPAVPSDYEAFARLMPELGVHDPIPERARWEGEMLPDTLFLEDAGHPVAYAWSKSFGDVGRVIHVVVDPARRARGAGGALMRAVAARLRAAGCARWELNVKVDNAAAIRLYERVGLAPAYRSTALWMPWVGVGALPRPPDGASAPPVVARAIEPAEDAALEAAFDILPGRLADLRTRGRIQLRLVDPTEPSEPRVGLASFDPAFPGAFPFAVARPALAAPLLEALRPHARPSDARLHLLVEHDDALTAALLAAGGVVSFEILHMVGELPPAG